MNTLSWREKEKQMREADIIAAAEKVFIRKGIEEASMDEIAKEAHFTKRTVYQYFLSKEDLYYAVALKGFKQLLKYCEEVLKGKTGFEKIKLLGHAYHQFYQDFPDSFRLMHYSRYIKTNNEDNPTKLEMIQAKRKAIQELAQVIEAGQKDQSIRSDLDSIKGAYAIIFTLDGFLFSLSETGKNFSRNHGIDQDEFIRFTIDLICDAFQQKNT